MVHAKHEAEKVPTPKVIKVSEIIPIIRILESSGGKNDGCLAKGKINGFGYRQNAREHVCYKSLKEVSQHVFNWFTEKLSWGWTLEQSLCYYNQGTKTNNCPYSKHYHQYD